MLKPSGFSYLAMTAVLVTGLTAQGQTTPSIDRVEEDWELVIASPSVLESGPQINTTMSPEGDNSRTTFVFNINYRDRPFTPGGLQVRCFFGSLEITCPDSQRRASCQTNNELITWTQRLQVNGGTLQYNVLGGTSTTWGAFGQGDNLDISVSTTSPNLNSYQPSISVQGSGVSWQSNRVQRMTLKQVRYYSGGQLVTTINTPRELIAAQ